MSDQKPKKIGKLTTIPNAELAYSQIGGMTATVELTEDEFRLIEAIAELFPDPDAPVTVEGGAR